MNGNEKTSLRGVNGRSVTGRRRLKCFLMDTFESCISKCLTKPGNGRGNIEEPRRTLVCRFIGFVKSWRFCWVTQNTGLSTTRILRMKSLFVSTIGWYKYIRFRMATNGTHVSLPTYSP